MPFAVEEMLGEKLYSHEAVYGLLAVIVLIFIIFRLCLVKRNRICLYLYIQPKGEDLAGV